MTNTNEKTIHHRDQIHRDTTLDRMSIALINTTAMQRLGRVYQLGYAHLVYRGGTHTRLSHAMGAAHVAGTLVNTLRQNYAGTETLPVAAVTPEEFLPIGTKKSSRGMIEQRWQVLTHLVQWAALLHDVGHVPLGHTLEDEFDRIFLKHDDFRSARMPYLWHEQAPGVPSDIFTALTDASNLPSCFLQLGIGPEAAWKSVMLIALHKEKYIFEGARPKRQPFNAVVAAARHEITAELEGLQATDQSTTNELTVQLRFLDTIEHASRDVGGRTFFPYMSDIVGNTICADYFDYLRRDAANVGLDVVSDERVASSFYVARVDHTVRNSPPSEDSLRNHDIELRMALSLLDKRGKNRYETCTGVLDLVRRRFRFAEIIYYHKTKVAASAMFAKAFGLIRDVPEVRASPQRLIHVGRIDAILSELEKVPHDSFGELRDAFLPTALLDPEIGDESLNLFLQHRAWRQVRQAHKLGQLERARDPLRAIALLQAITRRKLYKVCLTVDYRLFTALWPEATADVDQTAASAEALLDRLRNTKLRVRDDIEHQAAQAVGWPDDAVLLYVPPRKVQAKGIETYAFDGQGVVTLGRHTLVASKAEELNRDYQNLWRLILLVHPKYVSEDRKLSDLADELVRHIFGTQPTQRDREMSEACWFHYIPKQHRNAADQYRAMVQGTSPPSGKASVDWTVFGHCLSTVKEGFTVDSAEHADRAYLLKLTTESGHQSPLEAIRRIYDVPGTLSAAIAETQKSDSVQLKLDGDASPSEVDFARRRAALEVIASQLRQ